MYEKDEFIVLASDGIWDVIGNEDLKKYIHYMLSITHDLDNLCEDILKMCRNKVNIINFYLN
jgi:protein phosphatase 1B